MLLIVELESSRRRCREERCDHLCEGHRHRDSGSGTRTRSDTYSDACSDACTDAFADAPAEIILAAADAARVVGRWQRVNDPSAAAGMRLWDPDASAPKLLQAAAQPAHYIEFTVSAVAGVPYRLWVRGRADQNLWTNDSVFVQFTNTVGAAGASPWRIGTSSATVVSIEEGSAAGLSGWGWADNGYGIAGEVVIFATTGTQTIRIQPREDGISIDQVVLSSQRYLSVSPGAARNDTTLLR